MDYQSTDFNEWQHFDDRTSDDRTVGPARRVETVGRHREPLGEMSRPPHAPGHLHDQLPRQDPGGRRLTLPRGQDPAVADGPTLCPRRFHRIAMERVPEPRTGHATPGRAKLERGVSAGDS